MTGVQTCALPILKHAPIPTDKEIKPKRAQVINLMDALRKSVGEGEATVASSGKKKAAASAKGEGKKGIALVKSAAGKRKSA